MQHPVTGLSIGCVTDSFGPITLDVARWKILVELIEEVMCERGQLIVRFRPVVRVDEQWPIGMQIESYLNLLAVVDKKISNRLRFRLRKRIRTTIVFSALNAR